MLGAGDLEKALETMETMRLEGIEPDVITYTSLIKACSLVTVIDPLYNHNNNSNSSSSNSSYNIDDDDDEDDNSDNSNDGMDNNNNHKIHNDKIIENSKTDRLKPQTYRFKPMLISGKNPVILADDLFLEMQQRDNHFSNYIAPNQLTYERYYC